MRVMLAHTIAQLTEKRVVTLRALASFLAVHGRYPKGAELAAELGEPPSKVQYYLRTLEKLGLVRRQAKLYTLTEEGLKVLRGLNEAWQDKEVAKALGILLTDAAEDRR